MNKKKLKKKAELWMALRGLKSLPGYLDCKDVCAFYPVMLAANKCCSLRGKFTFIFDGRKNCIKWLDDE